MDTDYDTYAVVYACNTEDIANLWIMAREKYLDRELHVKLIEELIPRLPNYDWTIAMLESW